MDNNGEWCSKFQEKYYITYYVQYTEVASRYIHTPPPCKKKGLLLDTLKLIPLRVIPFPDISSGKFYYITIPVCTTILLLLLPYFPGAVGELSAGGLYM